MFEILRNQTHCKQKCWIECNCESVARSLALPCWRCWSVWIMSQQTSANQNINIHCNTVKEEKKNENQSRVCAQPILGFILQSPVHDQFHNVLVQHAVHRSSSAKQSQQKSPKIQQETHTHTPMHTSKSLMKSDPHNDTKCHILKSDFSRKVKNTKMLWKAKKLNATNYYHTLGIVVVVVASDETHPILFVHQTVCCVWFQFHLFTTNTHAHTHNGW